MGQRKEGGRDVRRGGQRKAGGRGVRREEHEKEGGEYNVGPTAAVHVYQPYMYMYTNHTCTCMYLSSVIFLSHRGFHFKAIEAVNKPTGGFYLYIFGFVYVFIIMFYAY